MSIIEDSVKTLGAAARTPMAYYERCKIRVSDGQVMAEGEEIFESIPVATLSSLWLGPGTSCTNEAMKVIHKRGCVVIFCGGGGLPAYSFSANYRSPRTKLRQFGIISSHLKRKSIGVKILNLRHEICQEFEVPTWEQASGRSLHTMEELMLFEARQMKKLFRYFNEKHGVSKYPSNIKLLNHFLYSFVVPPIVHFALDPNVGIIHGKNRGGGLVFDIADVFKPVFTIALGYENMNSTPNQLKAKFLDLARKERLHKRIISVIEGLYDLGSE